MMSLKEIAHSITIVLMSTLIIFALLDNILIVIVKARKPSLQNKYYDFHRRHGFLKVTFLKLIGALIIVYFLLEPIGKSGALAALIWAYGFFVTKLLIDLIKRKA
ncbi:MAG: hypothetical protein AB1805_08825 [Nitrospirota bacterium]